MTRKAYVLLLIFIVLFISCKNDSDGQDEGLLMDFSGAIYSTSRDSMVDSKLLISLENGFIQNELMAFSVGETYLKSIYPELFIEQVNIEANLVDGIWYVFVSPKNKNILGGTAAIKMQKSDGRILGIYSGE